MEVVKKTYMMLATAAFALSLGGFISFGAMSGVDWAEPSSGVDWAKSWSGVDWAAVPSSGVDWAAPASGVDWAGGATSDRDLLG